MSDVYFDFALLPDEILGNFIFGYFRFEYWLQSLIFVCKQWYQAAILADDKQLLINTSIPLHMYKYFTIASRFKVTTIALTGLRLSKAQLAALFKSSPRLHTFVQFSMEYDGSNFPGMTFDSIKTACISSNMMDLFPNATRVQFLDQQLQWNSTKKYPNVVELAVQWPVSVTNLLDSFPSLKVLHSSTNLVKEVPKNIELRISSMSDKNWRKHYSYDQIWAGDDVWTGDDYKSPLLCHILRSKVDDVKQLAKYSSVQYEIDLQDRINEYKFPAVTRQPIIVRRPKKTSLSSVATKLVAKDSWKAFFYYEYFPAIDGLNMLLERDEKENIEAFLIKNAVEISENMTPAVMERLASSFDSAELHKIFTKEQLQRMISCADKTGNIVHHVMDGGYETGLIDEYIREFGPLASDWLTCKNANYQTPIQRALTLENMSWIEYLVNAGAKIDGSTLFGDEKDNRKSDNIRFIQQVIKLIIKKNANSSTDINWLFDLHWCNLLIGEKIAMLDFFVDLLKIEDLNKVEQDDKDSDEVGTSLFNYMIKCWEAEIPVLDHAVKKYNININLADTNHMTPLLVALKEQREDLIGWLLENGAEPSPAKVLQPLYELARQRPMHPVYKLLGIVDLLLFYGADINAYSDEEGTKVTPLLGAIASGQLFPMIEYLVARGARPDLTDSEGKTAIHYAIFNSADVMKYLAAHVDVNKVDNNGIAPIHYVLDYPRYSSLLSTLVKCGADCNLPKQGFNMTPLMIACLKSDFHLIQELLKHNVSLQAVDVHGHSFVYYLVKYFKGYSVLIPKGND